MEYEVTVKVDLQVRVLNNICIDVILLRYILLAVESVGQCKNHNYTVNYYKEFGI